MDGLSAATSVIAVIQIAQHVFTICQTYYSEVKDARKDIQLLRDEMTSLQDVLTHVKELGDSLSAAELSSLKLLNQPNGPLERCQAELEKLFVKLEAGANPSDGKMKQFGLRALKWPFSSKDVQKIITHIEKSKTLFNLALSSDQMYVLVTFYSGYLWLFDGSNAHI
jgi:Fungal N-terminal domain of STAND proteins